MGYIATSKFGDCTQCQRKSVPCVKPAKDLICLECNNRNKATKQIAKHKSRQQLQREKGQLRPLIGSGGNVEMVEKEADDKIEKAQMDLFWLTAEREIAKHPYCSNCNAHIPDKKMDGKGKWVTTKLYYRAATAHVIPKRKEYGFPSVAANLDNYLVLGSGCGCHNTYDNTWEDAAQMKIFPVAIEKFKKLYPHIALSERKNIPDVFRQEIEP